MRIIYLAAALLQQLDRCDVADLPTAERRRLARVLRWAAEVVEAKGPAVPKEGVLARLADGERAQ
jgi:hypothetical protein